MTSYDMRISDWSSDVCSSDLLGPPGVLRALAVHDVLELGMAGHDAFESRYCSCLTDDGPPRRRFPADPGRTPTAAGGRLAAQYGRFGARREEDGRASCRERGGKIG